MSKAVIFFAPGLEECEGLLCVDILRRAGVEVTIAAVGGEKIVKSARQISVVADALAEELDYTVFDACILPGGIPGVPNLKADATVRRVCRDFAAEGKVVAAICAAPTALAAFGVLNGKKATVYPGMDADLTAAGASYTGLPLTIDGSIVTGEALGAAIPFALALARILAGAAQALERGGADFLVICTNTMHKVAPQIAAAIERVREKAEAFSSRSAQDDLLALPKGDKSKYVLQTLEYIAAHYADADINITTIARSIGISEGHLSHVFKKETSYTALGYLTLYRIHMARRLLADCRYKVYEVAGMVGYRDVAYFGSTFKKLTGLSPSEYQDRCR